MSAQQDADMAMLASSIEYLTAYNNAGVKIWKLTQLFQKANHILEERSYREVYNDLWAKAKETYGEGAVNELHTTVSNRLEEEEDAHGKNMTSFTCIWFVLALVFAKHPVESFANEHSSETSYGIDVCAQVFHLMGGNEGAWDDNAQIHSRLLNLASSEFVGIVNGLLGV